MSLALRYTVWFQARPKIGRKVFPFLHMQMLQGVSFATIPIALCQAISAISIPSNHYPLARFVLISPISAWRRFLFRTMCLLGEERYTVDLHAASDPFFYPHMKHFFSPFAGAPCIYLCIMLTYGYREAREYFLSLKDLGAFIWIWKCSRFKENAQMCSNSFTSGSVDWSMWLVTFWGVWLICRLALGEMGPLKLPQQITDNGTFRNRRHWFTRFPIYGVYINLNIFFSFFSHSTVDQSPLKQHNTAQADTILSLSLKVENRPIGSFCQGLVIPLNIVSKARGQPHPSKAGNAYHGILRQPQSFSMWRLDISGS